MKVPREYLALISYVVIVIFTIVLAMVNFAPIKYRGDEKLELSLRPGWIMEIRSQGEVGITFSGDKPFSGDMIFKEGGEDFVSSVKQNFTYETRKMVNSPVSVYFKDRQCVNVTIDESGDESEIFVVVRPSNEEWGIMIRNVGIFIVILSLGLVFIVIIL